MIGKFAMLTTVLVVAAFGLSVYLPSLGAAGPGLQGTASTTTTTFATTCTTTYLGGNTTFISGNFSSPPTTQVRIDYAHAVVTQGQDGTSTVAFVVGFTNLGSSDIYTIRGCGSSLNSTILSGAGVVQATSGYPRCLCAEGPSAVAAGQSSTASTPGCWSGFSYQVVHSGSFTVRLTLYWSDSQQIGPGENETSINATFTV